MSNDETIRHVGHRNGLLTDCAIVSAAILGTFVVVGFVASVWQGNDGWTTAATAGGISWIGGLLAIALHRIVKVKNQVNQALFGILAGMTFRMGLPLVFCLAMLNRGGAVVESGLLGMIAVYYFVGLTVETAILLRQVRETSAASPVGKVS